MRKAQTHFEQIPVEVVKKIAEEEFFGKKVVHENVVPGVPVKKTESHGRLVRWSCRNRA
jgi:hypothetical protein